VAEQVALRQIFNSGDGTQPKLRSDPQNPSPSI
jgi:hypothetical protein